MIRETKTSVFKKTVVKKLAEKFTVKTRSKKHVVYVFKDKKSGNTIVTTRHSHGTKITKYNMQRIREDLRLSSKLFLQLIDCPLSSGEYVKILKEKGLYQ